MHRKDTYIGAGLLTLAVILAGGSLSLRFHRTAEPDTDLTHTITLVNSVRSYVQHMDTEFRSDGELLRISGIYLIDDAHNRYAFTSTTTLVRPKGRPVVFAHDDISIGSVVYVRIQSQRDVPLAVPSSPQWRHFVVSEIPAVYRNIAITGPLVDTLKLFGENGAYLTQTGNPKMFPKAQGRAYTFTLSSRARELTEGTLGALFERIGTGTITLITDETGAPKTLLLDHNAYHATTTFSRLNDDLNIIPPSESH